MWYMDWHNLEWWQLILVFLVGGLASFINSLAGGGSTISLPALIFIGLPPTVANGTNRVAILMGNLASVRGLRKGGYFSKEYFLKLLPFVALGALLGAGLGVQISDALFRKALAITLIWVAIAGQIKRKKKAEQEVIAASELGWKARLAFFAIGFYGGFIQVGVGFLLMMGLSAFTKMNILRVNAIKGALAVIFIGISVAIFSWGGKIAWPVAVLQALGGFTGGWLGSRVQMSKGEEYVRRFVAIASLAMALSLLRS
jgi:uncharacterized membrane protein YfcA